MRCYDGGKRRHSSHFILFVLPTGSEGWRVGAAVSRKVGGAVQRNRIKRLLREFFRLHQHVMPLGVDVVAVPKKSLDPHTVCYQEVEQELLSLVNGLQNTVDKTRNSTTAHVRKAFCSSARA